MLNVKLTIPLILAFLGTATAFSTLAPSAWAQPATAPSAVDYQIKGTHFQYPANWWPKKDDDYELHLVPAAGPANRNITFDIPEIPAALAWMVSLGRVESGYTDDLKKKHAGVHIDSAADQAINGGKARLVQSSWQAGGVTHHDVALLIQRKSAVYVLTCDADEKDLAATRADFDKIVASLRWDK